MYMVTSSESMVFPCSKNFLITRHGHLCTTVQTLGTRQVFYSINSMLFFSESDHSIPKKNVPEMYT